MKLGEYLRKEGIGIGEFAEIIGKSRVCVSYWVNNRRKPSHENMSTISVATGGEVTANDFYEFKKQ